MDVRVAFFLLSSLPSLMGLPVLMQKYMRSVGGGCVSSNHLSWVEIVCLLLSSPPPFLRPPTFSFLPSFLHSYFFPFGPSSTISQRQKKGYDIILEWALRYIALFPPSFLSISPSAALLLPLGDLLTDDWGTTFVHYTTSSSFSLTLS